MLRITAVRMTAVPDSRENWFPFENWLGECFEIELSLPRKTLGIPILNDMRLPHSAVRATNAGLRVVELDAPNMPTTVTYRFVIFHRIRVSAIY